MADETNKHKETVRDAAYGVGLQFVRLVLDELIRAYHPEDEVGGMKAMVTRRAQELTALRGEDGRPLIPGFQIPGSVRGAHVLYSIVHLESYTLPKLKNELGELGLTEDRINHLLSFVLSIPRLAFRTFVANHSDLLRDILGAAAPEEVVKQVMSGEIPIDTETMTYKLLEQSYGLAVIED